MIEIQAPQKIKRDDILKGIAIIELDKEVNARKVSVSFDNVISYPNPCTKNFSKWSIANSRQLFTTGKLRYTTIPFEFKIHKEVPPSYEGGSLTSSWKINVIIDIPMSRDIHAEMKVEVER